MAVDYIPSNDAEFGAWLDNFTAYLQGHFAALGVTSEQVSDVTQPAGAWDGAFTAHTVAQNAARGARDAKDQARAAVETAVRRIVVQIQANPGTTDAQRQALGITVRGQSAAPAGPPTTLPVLTVDTSVRLVHTVSFADSGTPTRRAKPAGVMACEIWHKVGGPAPVGAEGLSFLAVDTATPYVAHYDGAVAGQTVYYVGRWLSSTGEPGEWGTVISATVGG